jgi:DNA-directed RNA polymerase specialized sigma24 family protein
MLDGSRQSLSHFVDRHLGPLTHYLERRLGMDDSSRFAHRQTTDYSSQAHRQTRDDEQPETPQSSQDSDAHSDRIQQIVRATFRDAFNHLKPYANGTTRIPMRLWLIRRAERHIRNSRSQHATLSTQPELQGSRQRQGGAAQEPALPERGSLDWLRPIMRDLPRRQEVALCLALFEKYTPEEIGYAMGVRPARAMRLLRGALLKVNKRVLAQEGLDE